MGHDIKCKWGQTPFFQEPSFERAEERSERLDIVLSRSNGLSGERVHDLERSTANDVLQRTAALQGEIPCKSITG